MVKLNRLAPLSILFSFLVFGVVIIKCADINAQSNFLKNSNNSDHWDYQDVLVLGVGADWDATEVKEILTNYHFDKVIVISEGSDKMDYAKAALAKIGIPTGTIKKFDELKGKNINRLHAHSWGSSETINFLSRTKDVNVGNLHCYGSPESVFFNHPLRKALGEERVGKVFFHINDGDGIAKYRHFPKLSTPGFSNKIEFHFYKKERRPVDTEIDHFGFDKYYHYNCPEEKHPLPSYFKNSSFVIGRDIKHSAFRDRDFPTYYSIPSYFVSPGSDYSGKSLTEAQTLTETVNEKHRALIVGKGREADLMYKNMVNSLGKVNVKRVDFYKDDGFLQREARKFGADVILGVKDNKTKEGGVLMDPKPVKIGKGGAEIKKKIINSKPGDNTLYWDYK